MRLNRLSRHLVVIVLALILSPLVAHALPGDLNSSGRVDGYDLILFGLANGSGSGDPNWNPDADLDGNGAVDATDLQILSAHFGKRGLTFGLWVGDESATEQVSKLTSNGTLLKKVGEYGRPISLSSDQVDGTVWVADEENGQLIKLAGFDGAKLLTVNGTDPYSVSVDSQDGTVWVADYDNDRIVKLLPQITDGYTVGTDTGAHIIIKGFNRPRSVSVNQYTGVVWVADTNNNRVVRLSPDITDGYDVEADTGKHTTATGFYAPYAVSVDVADGTVWVADFYNNQVVRLSAAGTTETVRVGGFNGPVAIAANYMDGSVWIADTGNDQVVRLSSDGTPILRVGGFEDPYALAVNPLDGTCWVADYGNNQVVKLSASGSELKRLTGFTTPIALALTPDEVSDSKYPTATTFLSANNVDVSEVITFTGTGQDPDGQIALYEWDFDGDGTFDYSSTESGVTTHAYGTEGTYNPVFRVTDNHWLTASDYSQIVRIGMLRATATADVTSGTAPLSVYFTGSFFDPLDGLVDSYQWDFDGDDIFDYFSETSSNTSHTYGEPGTYTATFKVKDGPHTARDSLTISVSAASPAASASVSPALGPMPLTVDFNGSGTDPDGTIVMYAWDFEGDGTFDWYSVSSGYASHTYTQVGSYTPTLRVTDDDGQTDTASASVNVTKIPPVPVAKADQQEAHPPFTVNFDAGDSVDPDGSIVKYEWNFAGECQEQTFFSDYMEAGAGDWTADTPWAQISSDSHSSTTSWTDSPGSNYANNANAALTSPAFDLSGTSSGTLNFWHRYHIESGYDYGRVEISTDGGTTWAQPTFYTGTLDTWSQAQIDIGPYLPSSNVKIRFRLTSDSIVNYDGWYIDDVTVSECRLTWTESTEASASYAYTEAGTYTAFLRVTDDEGNTATTGVGVTVVPLTSPLAEASADVVSGMAPLTVQFTGTGTPPTGGSIAGYQWDFGEAYVWVADTSNDQVVRLYHDGSGEVSRKSGFNDPYAVSINPSDGTVWVADRYNNQVVRLSASGKAEILRVGGFSNPYSVSVDPSDGSVWVADYYNHRVVKLASDGKELFSVSGFNYPTSVAVNTSDGSVWLADDWNDQVVKLGSNGTELVRVSGFSQPLAVSVNPTDGTVWVTDDWNDQVVRLASNITSGYDLGADTGSHVLATGFSNPYSVSVNSADGSVWVADYSNDQVVKLASDGVEVLRVGGFENPIGVAVNSTDGSVWVADYYNSEVVQLGSDGTELHRLGGFSFPRAVAVADGGAGNFYTSTQDGSTTHVYTNPGIYQAIFTITDSNGHTATRTVDITVQGTPTVTLSSNTSSGPAPLEVFFSAAVTDLDGTIQSYAWDFGDGTVDQSSETAANARHVYPSVGTFEATLQVTDNDGYSSSDVLTISATQNPPTATANATPLRGNAPLTVNFMGSGTDLDGSIAQYEWDFDNDGVFDFSSSTTAATTHTYNTPGTYTATLRVTDDGGLSDTDSVNVLANPSGTPSALLSAVPTVGVSPLQVQFCAHGMDPDGAVTTYELDADGDATYEDVSPSAFGDNMEDGEAYWTPDPPWERINSDYYSQSYAWTDSPGGNYADNADVALTSITIDLSTAAAPKLSFWHHYAFKYGDYGRVEVSGNDGGSWAQLGYYSNHTLNPWTKQVYDLSAYAGNATVKIRFRVTSNASDNADGWYVDDVWVGDCETHTYSTPGYFTATLRVTDNDGKQSAVSELVSVFASENRAFVWIADYSNNRVVKLADDGTWLATVTGFNKPRAIEVDPVTGDVWVADTSNNRVVKLSGDAQIGYDITKENTPDGTLTSNGGTLYGDAALVAGKFNNAFSFDGNGDYVQIPDSPVFRMDSWTMEAWIKPDTFGGIRTIVGKVSQAKDFALVLNGEQIGILVYDQGRKYLTTAASATAGQWYHVAGVYDVSAGTLSLYVDGVLVDSSTSTPNTSNTDPLMIGKSNCCNEAFSGIIDDVRVWNLARTATEIADGKDSQLAGNEPGLVGYWRLDATSPSALKIVTGFNQPWYLSVDPKDSSVWVTDYSNHQVVKLASDGTELKRVDGFYFPKRVLVSHSDSSVWVTDTWNNQVVKLDSDGNELKRISGFSQPTGISVNQADGTVYVGDFYNGQVVKLASDGTELVRAGGFYRPLSVSVNQSDKTVWVAQYDNNEVVKLTPNLSDTLRLGSFNRPHDLRVNPDEGTVWVADHWNHQMVKLAPDGTELLRLAGFYYPISMSLDTLTRLSDQPPVASAGADPLSGDAPLTVSFTGSATDDGTIVKYEWDFDGDGSFDYDSATTADTTYTYAAAGTYNPVFRVTDNEGMTGHDGSMTIHVGPLSVYATVSPSTGNAPLSVTLNASVRGMAAGNRITRYEWDYEGDGIYDFNSSDTPKTSYTYPIGQTYQAVLRVTDSLGQIAFGHATVNVQKTEPTATNNASPTTGAVPLTVNLYGYGYDPDGSIVRYEWDYDSDGVYDWFSDTTGNAHFSYKTVGTYEATIRVTDNDGFTATAARTITVSDRTDAPTASASADSLEGAGPLTVNFSGTANDPDDGTITLYEWDFEGDGTYDHSSTDTGDVAHTYDSPGLYVATLRVTDADNLTATAQVLITVKDSGAPTAVANADPTSGPTSLTVNFDAEGSSDPDGQIVLYEWTFGNEVVLVADYNNNSVKRITSLQVEKTLSGFDRPYRLAIDQTDRTVWVANFYNNQVVKLKADSSGEIFRVNGFDEPYGLSVNPNDSSVWVADYYHHQVVKLDKNGTELVRVDGFYYPTSVAVDPADGSVWVADYNNNEVVRLDAGGTEIARISGFNRPFWVSVDQDERSVWVADRYNHRVVKLAGDTPDGYTTSVSLITANAKSSEPAFVYGDAASGTGYLSGGVTLDGNGDYILIPAGSAPDLESFTIESWIKPATTAPWPTIFMRGDSGSGDEIWFGLHTNGTTVRAHLDSGPALDFGGSTVFADGAWHHVALVYDATAGVLNCFVDGAAYGTPVSTTVTFDFDGSHALIGANFNAFNANLANYFNGEMDDVRIWDVVRSDSEIADNKDAELTGDETGLVGYWKLNALQDDTFHKIMTGFNEPLCTAVDPNDGSVWVCDYVNNQMVKISADAEREIIRVSGFNRPHEAFVNPADGTVWVADHWNNQIVKLTSDGREVWRMGGFNSPTSVVAYNTSFNTFSSETDGSMSHTYNRIGEYLVTLRVTDNDGNSDTDTVSIRAGEFPESLPIAYPTSGPAPLEVRFAANGDSPKGTIVNFYWDFDGNGTVDWSTYISENYVHTYQTPGTYTATQRVTDNRGIDDTKSVTITVTLPEGAPTAEALALPDEGTFPLDVSFTGLAIDADGFIKTYEWDFDGDGTFDYGPSPIGVTSHTYGEVGIYNALLRVTDDEGNQGTDTVRVEVKPEGAPTAKAEASQTTGDASMAVKFTGSGTDDGTIALYEWDFEGDGTYDASSPTTGDASHAYTTPGSYNAILRVRDDEGLTDTHVVTINVSAGITATLSHDFFDPSVGENASINSILTTEATVTVTVKDRAGNVVRTLVDNVLRAPGYYSDPWDGKDDAGALLEDDVYLFVIDYVVDGQPYTYDVTNNVSPYDSNPSTSDYPETFDPFNYETNFIKYTLDAKAEVTVYISYFGGIYGLTGPTVRTLVFREPQKAGSYVLVWDGTDDNGNLVEPHTYVIGIVAWSLPENAIILSTKPVISDLVVTPAYFNPDAGPYSAAQEVIFTYTLSKEADVTATIYNEKNYLVRTVTVNDVPAGAGNTITWDGKNENEVFVAAGTYRLKLLATDKHGNESRDKNALLVIFY